ncbi:MAG: PAS domain S-box protein [Chloroflexota bacterium]
MWDQIKHFFTPPLFADREKTYTAWYLTMVIHVFLVLLLVYMSAMLVLLPRGDNRTWLGILLLLVCVGTMFLLRRGYVQTAVFFVTLSVWLLLMTWAARYGGLFAPAFAVQILLVVSVSMVPGFRVGLVFAALNSLCGLAFLYAAGIGVLPIPDLAVSGSLYWLAFSLIFFACVGLVNIAKRNTEMALAQAHRELAARERIEQDLRQSEEKFAKAFQASPNAMLISELADGIILDVNKSFEFLSGFTRQEAIGKTAAQLNVYLNSQTRDRWLTPVETDGHVRDLEIDLRHKDGAVRTTSLSIERIELGGETCVITIIQDISERRQQEAALKQYAEQARKQADQLVMLHEISLAISSLEELPDVLESIYQQAKKRLPIDTFFVAMYEPENDAISFPIIYDEGRRYAIKSIPAAEARFVSEVYKTGKPLWISREAEELGLPLDPKVMVGNESRKSASLLFSPLAARDKIVGVISTQSYEFNAYTADDLALLTGIGQQVAVAVENAQLYTALQRELQEKQQTEAELLLTQQSLRIRETHLRTILDNMPFLIWLKDTDLRFLVVNKMLAESGNFSDTQSLIGKDDFTGSPKELAEKYQADDRKVMATKTPMTAEEPLIVFGETRWFETYKAPILDDADIVIGAFGFARDVTERKEAEASLRESEARFRSVFEDSTIGMILVRPDHSMAKVNQAFCRMLGYTDEEFQGKFYKEITYPEDVSVSLEKHRALFSGEITSYQLEKRYLHRQGHEVWALLSVSAVGSGVGQPHYAIAQVQDITERKQAEVDRENLIAELELRNTELEQFAYTVSHDLKAPLITIGGFLGFLERDMRNGDLTSLDSDIRNIHQAVHKMRLLLDELLELSRIGRLMNPPELAPFADIVQEALALVHGRLADKGVKVTVQPDIPPVLGDKARLVEVVQNLVENAVKYMGSQAEPQIWIGVRENGVHPIYTVRDNGIGIEAPYHEQIFGLFNKLDEEAEGTGIGLALVKRIVAVHNGRLWVESEGNGKGSTFCYTLNELEST